MAEIVSPHCKHSFDLHHAASLVTWAAAMTALTTTGASVGAEMGIIGGPVGGITGTIPGAVFDGVARWPLADPFRRCPHCGKI